MAKAESSKAGSSKSAAEKSKPEAKKALVEKTPEELDETLVDEEEEEDDEEEDDVGEEKDLEEDDSDDGDDDEEEDEEEDEAIAPAKVAKKPPVVRTPSAAPPSPENDPTWWVPHAVLGTIVLVGVLGFFGAFNGLVGGLLKKASPAVSASASAAPAASAPAPPPAATTVAPKPTKPGAPTTAVIDPDPTFGAKRIVVRYKGAKSSKQERTKDQAKARAEEAAKKLTGGAKFEDVAREFSDEESAKSTGGNLGNFKRGTYDPAIISAVEKLEVGKTSGVFESPEGFEIVTRTK